jgi:hypothetical protein
MVFEVVQNVSPTKEAIPVLAKVFQPPREHCGIVSGNADIGVCKPVQIENARANRSERGREGESNLACER